MTAGISDSDMSRQWPHNTKQHKRLGNFIMKASFIDHVNPKIMTISSVSVWFECWREVLCTQQTASWDLLITASIQTGSKNLVEGKSMTLQPCSRGHMPVNSLVFKTSQLQARKTEINVENWIHTLLRNEKGKFGVSLTKYSNHCQSLLRFAAKAIIKTRCKSHIENQSLSCACLILLLFLVEGFGLPRAMESESDLL